MLLLLCCTEQLQSRLGHRIFPSPPGAHPPLRVFLSIYISDVSTREFLVSGRKLPKPSLHLHFRQQQWPLGSVLVASGPLSSRNGVWQTRRGWHRSPRNEQLEKEVHGNSWWLLDPISSPSGSGIKLYQNHPQVHPSQSFPQPHPACLSFIDKKTRKKISIGN